MQVSWFSRSSVPFSVDYRACAMTKRAAETGLEFFSAWFCPYAQRAWIALEHHGLKCSKVEGLLPDAPGQDFKGYKKHPRLLELTFDLMMIWQLFSFLSTYFGCFFLLDPHKKFLLELCQESQRVGADPL